MSILNGICHMIWPGHHLSFAASTFPFWTFSRRVLKILQQVAVFGFRFYWAYCTFMLQTAEEGDAGLKQTQNQIKTSARGRSLCSCWCRDSSPLCGVSKWNHFPSCGFMVLMCWNGFSGILGNEFTSLDSSSSSAQQDCPPRLGWTGSCGASQPKNPTLGFLDRQRTGEGSGPVSV